VGTDASNIMHFHLFYSLGGGQNGGLRGPSGARNTGKKYQKDANPVNSIRGRAASICITRGPAVKV